MKRAMEEFKRDCGFYYSYFSDHAWVCPDTVQITLTYRCNLMCKMCNIRSLRADGEITAGKVFELIDESRKWGVPELLLLGGEPFLRQDLMSFVRRAGQNGMKTTIVTNGTLIDEARASEIVASPLTQLVISLDGVCADTHDTLRGIKGTYDTVIGAIGIIGQYKKAAGKSRFDCPRMILPATLMNANLHEVEDYICLANDLPVSAVGFQPVVIDNSDLTFNDETHPAWIPKHRLPLLDSIIDKVIHYKQVREGNQPTVGNTPVHLEAIKKYFRGTLRQDDVKCYVGYTRAVISPDGNVSLCGESIGNVHAQTLRAMWNSSGAHDARRRIRQCSKPCLQFCTLRPESELSVCFDELMGTLQFRQLSVDEKKDVTRGVLMFLSACRKELKNRIGTDAMVDILQNEIRKIATRLVNSRNVSCDTQQK